MALGESGPAGTAAIPFLVEALADPEQAEMAADALGSLGSVAKPVAVPLIAALKADNVDTRRAAADALGRISPPTRPAVRALREVIDDQEFYTTAQKAADDFMETVPTPLRHLGIRHPEFDRHAAARALWRLGRHDLAIPVLVELLRVSVGYLRRLAVITLGQIGPLARPELDRVIGTSHDPDAGVRSAAIEALAKIGGPGQVPAIIGALDDDDQTVRIRAAERLGLIGRDARVAIGRLKAHHSNASWPAPRFGIFAAGRTWPLRSLKHYARATSTCGLPPSARSRTCRRHRKGPSLRWSRH
jgi:HEAT repeat protein